MPAVGRRDKPRLFRTLVQHVFVVRSRMHLLEKSRKGWRTKYKPATPATAQSVIKQTAEVAGDQCVECELNECVVGNITERSTLRRIRFDRTSVYPKIVRDEVMALVPRDMFRNRWDELHRLHRELEERFKRLSMRDDMWIPPMPAFEDFLMPPLPPTTALFDDFEKSMRKTFEQLEQQIGGTAIVHSNQDVYRVVVDVQQFAPEEITVRTDNKCITVEGKHEEKKDQHGFVSRHFVRRYILPQGYDIGHVKPSLSSDGVLTITAPKLAMPAPGERIVPIQRINAPAIKAA